MKRKGLIVNLLLILVFLTGLGLLVYPTFSDYWNSLHQSRAIAQYAEQVAQLTNQSYKEILADARAYNQELPGRRNRWFVSEEDAERYEGLLNISGTGVMGYIEIPKIDCHLPIYHGTDEAILQVAVGHIAGSSLPIGGLGTHSVLSGHRGLPSAKLFTDLDKLVEGDTFLIRVLDEVLTYEVDQILIVLPDEMEALEIAEDKDYCTLVTCTPYGINTHRLLVRGHRVDTVEEMQAQTARVTADAIQIKPVMVAPLIAIPIVLLLLIVLLIKTHRK